MEDFKFPSSHEDLIILTQKILNIITNDTRVLRLLIRIKREIQGIELDGDFLQDSI